ncbi:polysaccharide biosynthesis/export family protein [Roseitranquillus sediminis]|uniref:polysaccharide biosynthesis/export family protein n=1 Tax=Roseitranquillus sediminis TaxID=2809051 RepID=UPI001D0BFF47|nr:polysaccharide biosynthesis/export family protein [Roseitranquillus sediminis]MBM9596183.1 polysaccharide biosynthesis/export family protein [Roseitranquillus sediminis]
MIRYLLAALSVVFFAGGALAQGSYQIQSGDVLQIEVLEDPSLNRSTLVLPDGQIAFPLAGTLGAAGRSLDQFRDALSSALAPNFATEPTVFVSVSRLAPQAPEIAGPEAAAPTIDVYAIGEFANPGRFDIEPGTTLLQFLAASGGFSRFAATKRIQLRRMDARTGRETIYRFNYDAIERGGRMSGQLVLRSGDVVVAPERGLFE